MKYIFLLSGDYINIGVEEILSLFKVKKYMLLNKILIVGLEHNEQEIKKIIKRLALIKSIYKLLFECKINEIKKFMKNFSWNSVYKESFCLRVHDLNNAITKKSIDGKSNKKIFNNEKLNKNIQNKKSKKDLKLSEKNLAGYIWHAVKGPKVNLKNPKTKIEIFIADGKAYCGLSVYENKENFEARQSHLRPFPHPSSLHPKVARALINITGIKENETLLDPFCGTGGFLIEAGLMKIKSIGCDINKIMINGCKENLKHYKIRNYKIKKQTALRINHKFDYVVTDLPYGLNSNVILKYEKDWKKYRINKKIETKNFTKNLEKFYLLFLKNLRKRLKKRAVIVFPSYVNHRKLLKNSGFKIEKEFEDYVHRSLTRKIIKIV